MHLLTAPHNTNDNLRNAEILECVKRNAQCQAFSIIHAFLEPDGATEVTLRAILGQKHHVVPVASRMTYKAYFDFANMLCAPGEMVCLANADIWFDETLLNLTAEQVTENTFVVCSRWGFVNNAGKWDDGFSVSAVVSQDAWIWRTPIRYGDADVNFTLGCGGCDNAVAYAMHVAGYIVINPTAPGPKSVKLHHEHRSQVHNYGTPVTGRPFLHVLPTPLG